MAFLDGDDRPLAEAISRLSYCNPFLPERIEYERQALGADFVAGGTLWHALGQAETTANVAALRERAEALGARLAARLRAGARPGAADLQTYEDVVVYLLFARYEDDLLRLIEATGSAGAVGVYRAFRQDVERLLAIAPIALEPERDAPHLFSGLFQIRRAFHYIFRNIVGGSPPIVRLAVDLYARHAPLPPQPLPAHGRRRHADHRPLRHRQGAGGPRDRPGPLRPL
jgi:hypothetical protein